MLRWASELAASGDAARARMDVAALAALGTSELLQAPDQQLVMAVIDSILIDPVGAYEDSFDESSHTIEIDSTDEGWQS